MKIIITQSFHRSRRKYWGKDKISLDSLKSVILQKSGQGIYLSRPYMKIKFNHQGRSCRLLLIYEEDLFIMIPLFLSDKNDNQYGYNMIWSEDLQKKVESLVQEMDADMKNERFFTL